MKLNSHNEWDRLREVIVGSVEERACMACSTNRVLSEDEAEQVMTYAREAYPDWMLDEAREDLDGLCGVLKDAGVKVLRPDSSEVGKFYFTGHWGAVGDRMYNMRDLHLIVGDTVLESPSQERHRQFESMGLHAIWQEYFQEGCRWIAAPKPRLTGEYLITYYEDELRHQKLRETEILFEAANVVRLGRDLLYLVSRSGNYLGAKWIQSTLGNEYRVHITEDIYRASHIDSTVIALRPGLVLLNASRVTPKNCPDVLERWDKIYFRDIVPTPPETLEFHKLTRTRIHDRLAEIGIVTDVDHLASDWIGMNVLSLDQQTVVVDKRQTALIKTLESYGLTTVPIPFRHAHLLKGGIHCSTLDTVRESRLESYCD